MINLASMHGMGGPISAESGRPAYLVRMSILSGMMKQRLFTFFVLTIATFLASATASGGAQVINCPSGFNTSSGACGFSKYGGSGSNNFFSNNSGALDGSADILVPSGAGHAGWGLIYQTPVNNQAFTAKFNFVPNGYNLAFVVENAASPHNVVPIWPFLFNAGAGGEAGFAQFADGLLAAPNNLFALELDSYSPLTNNGSFTSSSAQIYQTLQAPFLPISNTGGYLAQYATNKVSTAPVSLNSPATASATTTRDTYSATITYDGNTLTLNLFDVTAGGSCPGSGCFTHSWTGVYIPAITGGTNAYVGLNAGTSGGPFAPTQALEIKSFTYSVNTPTGTPSYTAWNANSTYNNGTVSAASPVYSVAPGNYAGPQTVAISTSTSPHNYVCYVLSATTPALYPHPDSQGGCNTGTLYTGPISIASTSTLYAMAGSNNAAFGTGVAEPPGLGPPSTLVAGTYTISAGGSTAASPTFSPAAGTYTSTQNVALSSGPNATIYYTTDGSTPSVSSNRYIDPISLTSSATVKAISVVAGAADSSVASASYTISGGSTNPSSASNLNFSPGTGTYSSAQSVTITGAAPGTTIYYTRNGSAPTTSSSKYQGPVSVASTQTLQAVAVAADSTNSAVASATYSIPAAGTSATINFPNGFADLPTTIEPLGGAHFAGSAIQLTSFSGAPASNVYYKAPVGVQAFTTTFTWTAQCPTSQSGVTCGDGMGFTIVSTTNPNSPDYWTGWSGGALSWATECTVRGTCQLKSILVKFDLYDNRTGTPGVNLTGYYTGGEYPQAPNPQYDMAPAGIKMQSGHLMRANLTYDGATLYETVTDTVNQATYTNQYKTNIPALVGGNSAIVGFTGGMGAAQVQQDIRSWTYTGR